MIRIPLRDRTGEIIAHALVDDQFAHLAERRWFLTRGGQKGETSKYVRRDEWIAGGKGKKLRIYLHRLVTNCPVDMEPDHINGDPLDCRLVNLECVPKGENIARMNARRRGA